jgi:hypothetical protein
MKTTCLLLTLATLSLSAAFAQTPPAQTSSDSPIKTLPADSERDGFFLRGADAYMIHNGVTTKMEREVVFPNGLRVLPDGKVTLPNGVASTLRETYLLDIRGGFVPLSHPPVVATTTTTQTTTTSAAEKREVGVSDRDGITVSGTDVFITRNGITDKLTADQKLPNGVTAHPDGSILMGDGRRITLRVDQLLDLNGVLHDAPVRPSAPGPEPSSSTTQGN